MGLPPRSGRTRRGWPREADRVRHGRSRLCSTACQGSILRRTGQTPHQKEGKISREALKELGGWATSQMADEIYADEEAQNAREEARDAFAKIRGEAEPGSGE